MAPPYLNEAPSPRTRTGPDAPFSSMFPFSSMAGFDILDWHPAYQSCQRYFLDHAQHEPATQALCSLINIRLPRQWRENPICSASDSATTGRSSIRSKDWSPSTSGHPGREANGQSGAAPFVSLIPYIRRLIVTGFDTEGVLHGFFGDAWQTGISPLRECERRNYLFAAKHGGWRSCKKQYDLNEEETVPFMQPLKDATQEELDAADEGWSSWLAFEDWVIGPRAPRDVRSYADGRDAQHNDHDGMDGHHRSH